MPGADAGVVIAAAALEKAERLVTGNAKHFERIAGPCCPSVKARDRMMKLSEL